METPNANSRALVFSQRHIEQRVWHGPLYEFEDVIQLVDSVQMAAPRGVVEAASGERSQRSRMEPISIEGTFDLFFAVLHFAWQAVYLRQVRDWRKRSRKAVCFLIEQWLPSVDAASPYLEMLGEFDQIFVFGRASIPRMRAISQTRVDYLPIGADMLASCPYPDPQPRVIDVYSMGRRTPVVHDVLLRLMREERLTYMFNAVDASLDPAVDYIEHRALLRHLLKRSRYFLAYRHNDTPRMQVKTGGEEAIPSRYFEAIGGGPVIVGSTPDCADYREHFDWPDASISLPTETEAIEEAFRELNAQPERLAKASANNIINALRRHDWAYRWRTILGAAGLEPLPALNRRIERMNELAEMVTEQTNVSVGRS